MPKNRAKKISLRKVPAGCYEFKWDKNLDSCTFLHKDGRGGATFCGLMDATEVFFNKKNLYVLSLNYPRRYACVEVYDYNYGKGLTEIIVYSEKDVDKVFGDDFSSYSPKKIAETILSS